MKDDFEFLYERYKTEDERTRYYDNAIGIPITILSVIASTLIYFLTELTKDQTFCLKTFYFFIIGINFIFLIFAVVFLMRTYFFGKKKGYVYKHLSLPSHFLQYKEDLKAYFNNNLNAISGSHEELYKENLIKQMASNLDHNIYNNDNKAHYLFMAKKYSMYGLICLIIIIVIHFGVLLHKLLTNS